MLILHNYFESVLFMYQNQVFQIYGMLLLIEIMRYTEQDFLMSSLKIVASMSDLKRHLNTHDRW